MSEFQHRQIARKAALGIGKSYVAAEVFEMIAVKAKPGTHAAGPGADIHRIVDPGAPSGQVDVLEIGIQGSAPLAQAGQRIADQVGTQIQS